MVDIIEADGVDFKLGKGISGNLLGNGAIRLDLGVITDSFQEAVGDTGGAP